MNLTTIYLHASKKNQTGQIGKAAGCRRVSGENLEVAPSTEESGIGNQKLEIRIDGRLRPVRFVLHRNLIFTIFSSQKSDFHSKLSILYGRLRTLDSQTLKLSETQTHHSSLLSAQCSQRNDASEKTPQKY